MPGPDQIGFEDAFFWRLLSQAEAYENKNPFMRHVGRKKMEAQEAVKGSQVDDETLQAIIKILGGVK